MTKVNKPSRVSISAAIGPERDDVTPSQPDPVIPSLRRKETTSRSHASIYVSRHVIKALKQIAVTEDCKPHDLMVEGLRRVLRDYGQDFDTLNAKE